MKKRNYLTTAALAALVAAQMAMPVMAAETNNKLDKKDTSTEYNADDLKNNGHTTFGVIEADKVGTNQLSVEVPLYVTMAATSNTTDMLVPTEYEIKNTGKAVYDDNGAYKEGNIGVTKISTSAVENTWTIVASDADIQNDAKKMTFSLGNHTLTSADAGLYNDYKTVTNVNSQFVNVTDSNHPENNALKPIEPGKDKGLKPAIASKIASVDRSTGTGKTVGVVKVKYEFAALDADNKPITATTYVGDNRTDAGYNN